MSRLVRYQPNPVPVFDRIAALKQRRDDALAALSEAERLVENVEESIEELQRDLAGPEQPAPVPRVYVETGTIEDIPPVAMVSAGSKPKKKKTKPLTPRAIDQLENLVEGAPATSVHVHTIEALRERGLIDGRNKVTDAGLEFLRSRRSNGEAHA